MDDLRFLSTYADIAFSKNRLPHWEQIGAVYFVTFRLADSLPAKLLQQWGIERDNWLKQNPLPHTPGQTKLYQEQFPLRIENWMDAGMGSCILRIPSVSKIITDALLHFENTQCKQHAFVIMPNHIHCVFSVLNNSSMEKLVRSWKGFTSYRLKASLGAQWPGWQKDYFDRLVRDHTHFAKCVRYIRNNPTRAHLSDGEFSLYQSERARLID